MKLIKYDDNYADEFDIRGFIVIEDSVWEQMKNNCGTFPRDRYFGTNEYITYQTKEQFLNNFEEIDITDEEANILEKLFGDCFGISYGEFPDFDYEDDEE